MGIILTDRTAKMSYVDVALDTSQGNWTPTGIDDAMILRINVTTTGLTISGLGGDRQGRILFLCVRVGCPLCTLVNGAGTGTKLVNLQGGSASLQQGLYGLYHDGAQWTRVDLTS